MGAGKSIAALTATLDHDRDRVNVLLGTLGSTQGAIITLGQLRGIVLEGREYLAYEALQELDVVGREAGLPEAKGPVNLARLGWLREHLDVYIEALDSSPRTPLGESEGVELAWTLPERLGYEGDLPARSLAALMNYVISTARRDLVLVSPFLEERGLQVLQGALEGAARQGVRIAMISHGLDDADTPGYRALHYLRQRLPTIVAYSLPLPSRGSTYLLLHAKLIVADDTRAVLSSANLTQYGLGTHLEVGVGLSGATARQLRALAEEIMRSALVERID